VEEAAEVSEAVVVWSGHGDTSWPARDEARLVDRYGEEGAIRLLPRINALVDEFYESDAYATEPELAAVGDRAAARFRAAHPEISQDAVEALAWCYSWDWK
jgi:hypothetical protein